MSDLFLFYWLTSLAVYVLELLGHVFLIYIAWTIYPSVCIHACVVCVCVYVCVCVCVKIWLVDPTCLAAGVTHYLDPSLW